MGSLSKLLNWDPAVQLCRYQDDNTRLFFWSPPIFLFIYSLHFKITSVLLLYCMWDCSKHHMELGDCSAVPVLFPVCFLFSDISKGGWSWCDCRESFFFSNSGVILKCADSTLQSVCCRMCPLCPWAALLYLVNSPREPDKF